MIEFWSGLILGVVIVLVFVTVQVINHTDRFVAGIYDLKDKFDNGVQ